MSALGTLYDQAREIERLEAVVAERDAEIKRLRKAEAEAMALVYSHEGRIETLEARLKGAIKLDEVERGLDALIARLRGEE